jgi:dienelactone hydrolase
MRIFLPLLAALMCLPVAVPPLARAAVSDNIVTPATLMTVKADDGVIVHGAFYQSPNPKALILLFHQAGSSKDEYASIAPRLVAAGYSALAIDQRSGGTLFGTNETAAALGHPADYLEARRDLEAALSWGERQKLPVILWGSSYSASLVFLVAAEHPNSARAVLAFSPGEYFDGPTTVRDRAAHVSAPIYLTSASDRGEIEAARIILAASPAKQKDQYVPRSGGVHGSSTLITDRNPSGAADNWRAVLAFLAQVS